MNRGLKCLLPAGGDLSFCPSEKRAGYFLGQWVDLIKKGLNCPLEAEGKL